MVASIIAQFAEVSLLRSIDPMFIVGSGSNPDEGESLEEILEQERQNFVSDDER